MNTRIQEETALRELAEQLHRPLEEVSEVYRHEVEALERDATVKTYIPVFARRRTMEVLKH
jgi:hypothetical protein